MLPGNDFESIARAQAGDRAAFDSLVRVHFGRIYALLHRLVGNHEDAEDLAQECFVRAYRNLSHVRPDGSFAGWLARIAVHLAHDHHRSRGRSRVEGVDNALERAPDPSAGPSAELSRREVVRKVGEAVERLPYPLRTALVLRVLEGREYDEVAELCGLRPATVRTQVMKARRLLMRWIEPLLEGRTR